MYKSHYTPTSASPAQFSYPSFGNKATTQPHKRIQSLVNNESQSTSPHLHKARVLVHDFEGDDLDSLDIPDLPSTTLPFTNASRESINLISHPLPGNYIVADALAPFPSPAPQDEGCCRSKYQYDASLDACLEHFKDSKYWDKEHADDVVFSDLPAADGKVVPLDKVLSTIRQRRAHPESSDDNRNSRSQSRTVSMNQDSLEVKLSLDRMERELAETKAKLQAKLGSKGTTASPVQASPPHTYPPQSVKVEPPYLHNYEIKDEYQTPPQSTTSEKQIKSEQDTEDILAALGVTGAPKPVTAIPWPDQYVGHGSPDDLHMSRTSSSSKADT